MLSKILKCSGVLVMLPALAACVGPIRELYPPQDPSATKTVFVVSNGWHTSIVLRTRDIAPLAWPPSREFPDAVNMEVSWGDWDYFQAAAPSKWLALKAALWPTRSVLHVVGLQESAPQAYPDADIVRIRLSVPGYARLIDYLSGTFKSGAAPRPGLYPNSRFYPARGTFHLFNTCNNWIARALRKAGSPITPMYAITANNVVYQARRFGEGVQQRQ